MSKVSGAIKGAEAAQDAARAFDEVRKSADIQYAPISMPDSPPTESPSWETPGWLRALGRFFEAIGDFLQMIFEPLGRAFGLSWPVLQWILIGLAVLGVLFLLFRLFQPLFDPTGPAAAVAAGEWTPDRGEAIALLDEADRLAGEGRYDEATHLLLERSVSHIENARPGLLPPSGTAREISAHPALPSRARETFAVIATRVERSFFALRSLTADDWQAARAAYADFALANLHRMEAEPA